MYVSHMLFESGLSDSASLTYTLSHLQGMQYVQRTSRPNLPLADVSM